VRGILRPHGAHPRFGVGVVSARHGEGRDPELLFDRRIAGTCSSRAGLGARSSEVRDRPREPPLVGRGTNRTSSTAIAATAGTTTRD
jgi:hypothetical protein